LIDDIPDESPEKLFSNNFFKNFRDKIMIAIHSPMTIQYPL